MNARPQDREEDRLARVALNQLTEPGDLRVARLVAELGAVGLRDALLAEHDLAGLRSDVAVRLGSCEPARLLDRAQAMGARFVVPGDDEWPRQVEDLARAGALHQRGGPPLGLWVRGPLRLDGLLASVAVVGSRSSTTYGDDVAGELAAGAAGAGHPVVSGAAFGIDQAAHRGALAVRGPTVAVLSCGVERAYPAAHRALLDHLAAHGAVVSEAPPGSAPTRVRFLARNRLIAALARATVVVEAAVRSGALSTSSWAERLDRRVLGVPGPVSSATSEGVHLLLRAGAGLVASPAQLLEELGSVGQHLAPEPRAPRSPRDHLDLLARQVLDAVPLARGAQPATIAAACGVGEREVRSVLATLLGHRLVVEDSRGWRLTPRALRGPAARGA